MPEKQERPIERPYGHPDVIVGKPDNIYDLTPMDGDLYQLVLNPWIREIKSLKPPDDVIEREDWEKTVAFLPNTCEYVPLNHFNFLVKKAPEVYLRRLNALGVEKYNEIIRQEKELARDMSIMTRGVALIVGKVRSGKTAFMTVWGYLMKYLFGWKNIMDYLPRPIFGDMYLFNTDKLKAESERMKALHTGKLEINADTGKPLTPEEMWAKANGDLLFRKAACMFDEYNDYFNNKDQMNKMGKAIGNFHRKWGHNDLLIMGATPSLEELGEHTCLDWVTHVVKVFPHPDYPNECIVGHIYPRKSVSDNSMVEVVSDPFEFLVWGLVPRDYLNGDCLFHLYNTKNAQKLVFSKHLED